MVADKDTEALIILQEEAAEVAVACSKIIRFGLTDFNHERLTQEIGDVLALIDIVRERFNIDPVHIIDAKQHKLEKLKTYSSLFER